MAAPPADPIAEVIEPQAGHEHPIDLLRVDLGQVRRGSGMPNIPADEVGRRVLDEEESQAVGPPIDAREDQPLI